MKRQKLLNVHIRPFLDITHNVLNVVSFNGTSSSLATETSEDKEEEFLKSSVL